MMAGLHSFVHKRGVWRAAFCYAQVSQSTAHNICHADYVQDSNQGLTALMKAGLHSAVHT